MAHQSLTEDSTTQALLPTCTLQRVSLGRTTSSKPSLLAMSALSSAGSVPLARLPRMMRSSKWSATPTWSRHVSGHSHSSRVSLSPAATALVHLPRIRRLASAPLSMQTSQLPSKSSTTRIRTSRSQWLVSLRQRVSTRFRRG